MAKLMTILIILFVLVTTIGVARADYVSIFAIQQADFSLSGFSSGGIATCGPDSLLINNVTLGQYSLDIPPAGGSWDVYVSGIVELDFDSDGTWDLSLPFFDEYVGTYPSPGPSTKWGPGSVPIAVQYGGTTYNYLLAYDVDLDNSDYPDGYMGPNAYADFTLSGDCGSMLLLNSYLTDADNAQGGGDGVIDGQIAVGLAVTVVPVPGAVLLGAVGLCMIGWVKKRFVK